MTFDATVNPVVYEGGVPVFIDTEYDTWNMDPVALEKAFEIYPDVKVVVVAHLYGTPGKIDEIKSVCDKHGAVIVEDAAESLGATYKGQQTGTFGDYSCISFNGNKIITGSSGGMLLTDSEWAANKARKWSTQSRENAPWYQHEELGYNYRMSNVIAGVIRGQIPYLEEHIAQKKAIYMRYKEAFKDLPVKMNPYDEENSEPNFWLSCMIIDESIKDIDKLLYELRKSCKEQIMVFGFYNPFTAFSSTLANTVEPVILYANNKMEDLVRKYDMTYVDIHDMFLANDNYLPKKLEIHPTTLGYKAMAKSVISLIDKKTLAK